MARLVSGSRVKQVRQLKQLTQIELARRTGVDQAMIAFVESDRRQPSAELLAKIASETGFPVEYFEQGEVEDFPLGSLLFRAPASMTSRQEAAAHRYAQIAFEIAKKLSARLKPFPLRVPRLEDESAVRAASLTRAMLGLPPDKPIDGLIRLLERAGVLVFSLPESLLRTADTGPTKDLKHDAFSGWTADNKPVIVVCDGKPGDRLRFSVAHELCHLVLHQSVRGRIAEVENEANQFAAEFLTPAAALREELVSPVTLSSIQQLKPRWMVAMTSLIRRAAEVDAVTVHQYKYLMKQMALRRWRTHEPIQIAPEKPRTLPEMMEKVYGPKMDVKQIAGDLHVSIAFLSELLAAHALSAPTKTRLTLVSPRSRQYPRHRTADRRTPRYHHVAGRARRPRMRPAP